jgi:hypothetical protein
MTGSVVAAFIVVLTLQHAFACADSSQPKVINLEFDDKDIVEPVSHFKIPFLSATDHEFQENKISIFFFFAAISYPNINVVPKEII